MTKKSTSVFGTSIYRHISLSKPENPTRRPKPKILKDKLIYKRKLKAQKHRI